ncbi:unnamed protein product, partial [Laminaria digitata]
RNPNSPARASSSPGVAGAQGGSPAAAGGSYSQVARWGNGGDGGGPVARPSTCASYMTDHGKMKFDEIPRPVLGKQKDPVLAHFMSLAHGNLMVAADLRAAANAKAAAAAADSASATT